MEKQSVFQMAFDFFEDKPVVAEPNEAQLSSDAGLLVTRQFDERIELTQRFAEAFSDFRHRSYVHPSVLEMFRSRVYGILADYEDQNDHDLLRSDPVFKLIAGRSPDALTTDSAALCAGLLTPHSDARSVSRCIESYGRVSARSGHLRRARVSGRIGDQGLARRP